jgi:hypothetical protein
MLEEREADLGREPVAVLGHDDLGGAFVGRGGVVGVVAVDEGDDVAVLFQRAGLDSPSMTRGPPPGALSQR